MSEINNRHYIPNIERISLFAKIFINRSSIEDIIQTPHERGYARVNNPAHWVFLDTESVNELL